MPEPGCAWFWWSWGAVLGWLGRAVCRSGACVGLGSLFRVPWATEWKVAWTVQADPLWRKQEQGETESAVRKRGQHF